jgi:hypothetical protein
VRRQTATCIRLARREICEIELRGVDQIQLRACGPAGFDHAIEHRAVLLEQPEEPIAALPHFVETRRVELNGARVLFHASRQLLQGVKARVEQLLHSCCRGINALD